MAEGGGLLNRYRVVKPYRGFESLRLRQNRQFCDIARRVIRQPPAARSFILNPHVLIIVARGPPIQLQSLRRYPPPLLGLPVGTHMSALKSASNDDNAVPAWRFENANDHCTR